MKGTEPERQLIKNQQGSRLAALLVCSCGRAACGAPRQMGLFESQIDFLEES